MMQDTKPKIAKNPYDYNIADEPMLMGFTGSDGSVIGRITKNHYGSEVLNTTTMLFADIDIGNPQFDDGCITNSENIAIAAISELAELSRSDLLKDESPAVVLLQNHLKCHSEHRAWPRWSGLKFKSELGFRIYRTRGGLRAMCATHKFNPVMVDALLRFMYADPRYRKLCREQRVFRARLTPKHWRVESGSEEEARTCAYVMTIGSPIIMGELDRMVAYHDRATGCFNKGGYLA